MCVCVCVCVLFSFCCGFWHRFRFVVAAASISDDAEFEELHRNFFMKSSPYNLKVNTWEEVPQLHHIYEGCAVMSLVMKTNLILVTRILNPVPRYKNCVSEMSKSLNLSDIIIVV